VWGSDTGGYLGGRIAEELYARWLDLGAWSGLFEIKLDDDDGRGPDRPPWVYGPRLQNTFRAACEQRMRLLPYIFSLTQTSARTGVLMKPLAYVWPQDPRTYAVADEYLLGPSVLVAPILKPGGRREVYLPAGAWYDLHDPRRRFEGSSTISVTEPEDRDPVFLRGNSLLITGTVPMGNARIWNPEEKPHLKLIAVPGDPGSETAFEFADLFDANRHKTIRLERTAGQVTLEAPPLGAPVEVRLLCAVGSVSNLGRATPFGTDGPYATVRLPAGQAIRIVATLPADGAPRS
jgi:alpha-glucosidase (family GH31 glycosyl hydrolase)